VVSAIGKFVKGGLEAGAAAAEFLTWAVGRSVEAIAQVVDALIEGAVTITQILADTVVHPQSFVTNVMRALRAAGQTLNKIAGAFDSLVEDTLRKAIKALLAIGEAAKDIALAVIEVVAGAFMLAFAILLELTGTFRPMAAAERREARRVFGASLPYDQIHISIGDWLADLSSKLVGAPNAITTMRIVHFPSGTVLKLNPATGDNYDWMIHELTHVWQGETTGPFYMAHAVWSQKMGEGYDYQGKFPSREAALQAAFAAGKKFTDFNPEQEGDILAHYYGRLCQGLDTSAWDPYVAEVRT
jgi:hypothetical protein